MKSKILLINFTENDIKKLKHLPLEFDRGYLSDLPELTKEQAIKLSYKEDNDRNLYGVKYYFPHPVYEYKTIFVNLKNDEKVEKEFKDKTEEYTKQRRGEFFKYWSEKGVLIVFTGDYLYDDLINLGIPEFNLHNVENQDITVNCAFEDTKDKFKLLFKDLKNEVIMPSIKYISEPIKDEKKSFYNTYNTNNSYNRIYFNNNGSTIGGYCYVKYSDPIKPNFIILPQFRNNINIVERLLRNISKIYSNLIPEIYESDWKELEDYYPEKVKEYDQKIKALADKATELVDNLQKKKEGEKGNYKPLYDLLASSGDELKNSVINILKKYFKLDVIDSDKTNRSSINDEDIIIKFNNRTILGEVKSDKAKYPKMKHITQVWKHLKRHKNINEGALILNYDWETNPKDRSLAYTGEYEEELNDIIFIDTRVLYNLTIAIIDCGLSSEEAPKILLKKGRVKFDLNNKKNLPPA